MKKKTNKNKIDVKRYIYVQTTYTHYIQNEHSEKYDYIIVHWNMQDTLRLSFTKIGANKKQNLCFLLDA